MASIKIRFVKCPACLQILPEPPNVPVYQCGSCGKLLQAKIRKTDTMPTSSINDADTVHNATLDNVPTIKKCSSLSYAGSLHSSGECSSDPTIVGNQLLSENCSNGKLNAVRSPNKGKKDISDQDEPKDGSQLGVLIISNGNDEVDSDKHELVSPNHVKVSDVNVFDEDINNRNDLSASSYSVSEKHEVCGDVGSSTELTQSENEELSQIAVAETEATEGSQLAGSKAQVHRESEIDHDLRLSHGDELIYENESRLSSSLAMQRPARESISSDLVSSANEELETIQEDVQHGFNRVTSTGTFGAADFAIPSSELSDLIDMSKSPISRSVRAYYDDGVSSCDGTDDQFPDRYQFMSKGPYKASNHAASDGRLKRGKFQANRSSELDHQFRNQAPYMSNKKDYAVISDELLDDTRPTSQDRNWARLERDEYTSQLPFQPRGFQTGYRSGIISDPLQSAFCHSSSSHSHDQPAYIEHEKMKLLRMFHELQDQLNKACFINDKPNGRSPALDNWKDHHIPIYGHQAFEEDFNCSGNPGKFMESSYWPQEGTYSHVPFQGEATTSRHQIDHSMCCCPQVRHYSAQLPLTDRYPTDGFCKVHSGTNFCSSYGSCPSSPQWHKNSEFPMYYRGTLSNDKRDRENAAKNYLREKNYSGKRHLRPIAGGAPFITCHHCFKQLQLPADFLLFERRCHQVQCGACSELLKFSLVGRIHLVPYTTSVKTLPTEIDEYSKAVSERHLAPAFHGHGSSQAKSMSCSSDDDDGVSRSKSCSAEIDPTFQTERNETYPQDDRKKVGSVGHHKIYRRAHGSLGRRSGSSKGKTVSSESEELPTEGGSPLHRLMGYSSASDLIYNLGP